MTGDLQDIQQRLRLTLPTRWFGDVAPILDGILSGLASGWTGLYQLIQFVIQESRLKTASDQFLDLAAIDFLSSSFLRRGQENDSSFRSRLLTALQRQQATRLAINTAAAAAGYSLSVFEPAQPFSTGAYNVPAGLAWNTVGGWGSLEMPLESLLNAQPGAVAYESELWSNMALATPAGGALWLHVKAQS